MVLTICVRGFLSVHAPDQRLEEEEGEEEEREDEGGRKAPLIFQMVHLETTAD